MLKTIFPVFLLLFISLITTAQDFKTAWGKIEKSDLAMTTCPFDETANAMVLHDIGEVSFEPYVDSWRVILKRHKRIKIFNDKAFDLGNIEIPFYSYQNNGNIINVDVQVISPDGEKTKLSKEEIFIEQSSKYYSKAKFAAPNLQAGCIIEFRYKQYKSYLTQLYDWYFQAEIPTRYSNLYLEIPETYNYISIAEGEELFDFTQKNGQQTATAETLLPTNIQEYKAYNVPALLDAPYSVNIDNYLSKVEFQLQNYTNPSTTRQTQYFSTWEVLRKKLRDDTNVGMKMNSSAGNSVLKKIAIEATDSDETKMIKIFDFIKSNVTWNDYLGFYADENIEAITKNKSGTIAEINYGLINVLNKAGFTAFPLLTSTRSNGKCLEVYPILEQFNYVLAGVIIDNEIILLDASSVYNAPNYINAIALNEKAWFFTKDEQGWLDIAPVKSTETVQEILKIDEEGAIQGNVKTRLNGYFAIDRKQEIEEKKQINSIENEYFNEVKISDYTTKPTAQAKAKLEEGMVISTSEYGKKRGNLIYVDLILDKTLNENPFKLEERKYPINFNYPFSQKHISNFELPENYAVEAKPENLNIQFGDKLINYSYKADIVDNSLQIVRNFTVNANNIDASFYAELKAFIEQIVAKEKEQIVLKKKK